MSDQEPDKLEGVYAKLLRLFKEGEQSERQELREWLGILESGLRRDLLNRLVQTQAFLARLAYLERRDQQGQRVLPVSTRDI